MLTTTTIPMYYTSDIAFTLCHSSIPWLSAHLSLTFISLHAHMRSPRSVEWSWVVDMHLRVIFVAYILRLLLLNPFPFLPFGVCKTLYGYRRITEMLIFMKCNFHTINQRTSTWHFNSLIDHRLDTHLFDAPSQLNANKQWINGYSIFSFVHTYDI